MIPNKPILKKDYNGIMMTNNSMQLRNEENIMMLRGSSVQEIVEKLLPLLNGENTVDEICEKIDNVPPEAVVKVLEMLQEHFVIEDGDDKMNTTLAKEVIDEYSSQIDYLTLFSERILHDGTRVNKYTLFENIYNKTCFVIGNGRVATTVARELASNGIGNIIMCFEKENYKEELDGLAEEYPHVTFKAEKFDFILSSEKIDMVILADDITTAEKCKKINETCVKCNIPWISVRMGEIRFEVGPLVVPHETACYSCYTNRLNGNTAHYEEEITYNNFKNLESDNMSIFISDSMIKVAVGIMTWEVIKYLSKIFSCVTTGRVIHFNILNLEMKAHTVLKMPKCKVCSNIESLPFTEPYAVYLP